MPAASPRRQASPEEITLTSARTARRRETLPGLSIRHGRLGSSGSEEEEEEGGAAKEAAVIDMAERQIYCARVEVRAPAAGDSRGGRTEGGGARGGGEAGRGLARAAGYSRLGSAARGGGPAAARRGVGGDGGAGGLDEAACVKGREDKGEWGACEGF
jgi:hypothetical protein